LKNLSQAAKLITAWLFDLSNVCGFDAGLSKLTINTIISIKHMNVRIGFTQELGVHNLSLCSVKAKESTP
jgi:hypothetical protein